MLYLIIYLVVHVKVMHMVIGDIAAMMAQA